MIIPNEPHFLEVGDGKRIEIIAKVLHGSHLYGLNTENSDVDYKLIYMPSHYDVVMGTAKDTYDLGTNKGSSKNTNEDIDFKVYSFPKFINMLMKGDMVAMDMLFAPDTHVEYYGFEYDTNPFRFLRNPSRVELFTAKDMAGYAGYVHKQAAKYGIKGSRVATIRELLSDLQRIKEQEDIDEHTRLGYAIGRINTTLPYTKITNEHFEVLGAKHQLTIKLTMFDEWLQGKMKEFGHRALEAERNNGVDWKAMSHAVRACYQLKHMLVYGYMQLPLPEGERQTVLQIKKGELDFKDVELILSDCMQRVDRAKELSRLKDSINRDNIKSLTYSLMTTFWEERDQI